MKFFNRFRKTYKFNAKEKKIDVVCTKYVARSEFNITAIQTLEEKPNKRTTTIKKTTSLYEIKTELEEKFNKSQPSSRKLEEISSPEPLYTQVFNKSKSEENISSTSLQNHESDYDSQDESRRSSAKVVAEVEIHNASSNPVPELRKTVSDVELRKKELEETLTVTSDNATPKNALEENSSDVAEHSSSGEQHNKLSSPRLIKRPAHLALNDYAKAFKEMSSKNLEEHSSNFETTPIPPYSTKTRPSSMLIVEYARSLVDNSEEELEEILSEPIITSPRNTFDSKQHSSIARPTSLPFKLIDYSAEPEELVSPYDDLEEITSAPIITSPTNPYAPIFNERSTSFTLEEISSELVKTPVEENNTFVAEITLDDNDASSFDTAEKYTWLVGTKLEEDSSKTIEPNEDLENHENVHELSSGYEQVKDPLLEETKVEETKVEETKEEEKGNTVKENGVDKNIDLFDFSASNGIEEDKNVEEHLEEEHIAKIIKPEESKEDLFSTETTFYIPAEKLEESINFFNNNVEETTKVEENREGYSFIETQLYSPELEENTFTFNNNLEETLEDYEVHVVKHDNNAYDSEDSQSEEDYINFGVVEVEETILKNQKKVVHFNEQVNDIDGKNDNGDLILNGHVLEENNTLAEKREKMDLEESNVLNGHGSPYTEAATDIFFDAES